MVANRSGNPLFASLGRNKYHLEVRRGRTDHLRPGRFAVLNWHFRKVVAVDVEQGGTARVIIARIEEQIA